MLNAYNIYDDLQKQLQILNLIKNYNILKKLNLK